MSLLGPSCLYDADEVLAMFQRDFFSDSDASSSSAHKVIDLPDPEAFSQDLNLGMTNLMLAEKEERSGTDPSVTNEGSEPSGSYVERGSESSSSSSLTGCG